jgi:hypothetical protein
MGEAVVTNAPFEPSLSCSQCPRHHAETKPMLQGLNDKLVTPINNPSSLPQASLPPMSYVCHLRSCLCLPLFSLYSDRSCVTCAHPTNWKSTTLRDWSPDHNTRALVYDTIPLCAHGRMIDQILLNFTRLVDSSTRSLMT